MSVCGIATKLLMIQRPFVILSNISQIVLQLRITSPDVQLHEDKMKIRTEHVSLSKQLLLEKIVDLSKLIIMTTKRSYIC